MVTTATPIAERNLHEFSRTPTSCSSSLLPSSSSPGLQSFRTMIDCIEQIEQDNHHYNYLKIDDLKSIRMKIERLKETVKNPRIKKIIFEGQQSIMDDE
ncbi:hypothetical protein BLA29_008660, partial [Euroglyphus maynei]